MVFSDHEATLLLDIGQASIAFDLQGHTYQVGNVVKIGQCSAPCVAQLKPQNGVLSVLDEVLIGYEEGSISVLTVEPGARLTSDMTFVGGQDNVPPALGE